VPRRRSGRQLPHAINYLRIGTVEDGFECQADVMGAIYAGMSYQRNSHVVDIAGFQSAAQSATQLAVDLTGEGPPDSHPTSQQRQMAIMFGFLRSLEEDYQSQTPNAQLGRQLGFLQEVAEVRSDEDRVTWSHRLCEKIVHRDSSAVEALTLSNESPRWSKGAWFGQYRLRYTNSSDKWLRARITVQLAIVRMNGQPTPPFPVAAREFEFELKPGGSQDLAGMLQGFQIPGATFGPIFPRSSYVNYTLVSAQFLDRSDDTAAVVAAVRPELLSPSARQLYATLPRVADEAGDRFTHLIIGVCDSSSADERSCRISFSFPGSTHSRLYLGRDGTARIYNSIYDGKSHDEAAKLLVGQLNDIAAVFPHARIPKYDAKEDEFSVKFDIAKHAEIEAYVMHDTDDADTPFSAVIEIKAVW
jgi:hypothetical protein